MTACDRCGETITGNHAVRGGEPFCFECEEPLVPSAAEDHADTDPETVAEYEASKHAVVHVSQLMDGGQVR